MSRTPEQIKRARALAASIDKDAQVFAITDRNFEGRATRLIHETISAVSTGGGAPRRIKRSIGAWMDAHKWRSRSGREFYVLNTFTLAVGFVTAIAFAPLGFSALLPGIPVSLTLFFTAKIASKKWNKSSALEALGKFEVNPIVTLEDGRLAEIMLLILISQYTRLLNKHRGRQGWIAKLRGQAASSPYFKNLSPAQQDAAWQEAASRGFSGSVTAQDHAYKGSASDAAAKRKVAILIHRQVVMIKWLRDYIGLLREQIDSEVVTYLKKVDDCITAAVNEQVKVGSHHTRCSPDCCWGPRDDELDMTRLDTTVVVNSDTNETRELSTDELKARAQRNLAKARDVAPVPISGRNASAAAAKNRRGWDGKPKVLAAELLQKASETPQALIKKIHDQDKRDRATSSVQGLGETHQGVGAKFVERVGDAGGISTVQDAAVGAPLEALEPTLPETVQEFGAVADTHWAEGFGGDLAFGPVGWLAGVCLSEVLQSRTVNRPTDRAVGRIREAIFKNEVDLHDSLEAEMGKAGPDRLERALSRVRTHCMPRIHARLLKLHKDPAAQQLCAGGPADMTCADAVRLTRYVYKAWRQVIKAEANLAYVERAISNLEIDMKQKFPKTQNTVTPSAGGGNGLVSSTV